MRVSQGKELGYFSLTKSVTDALNLPGLRPSSFLLSLHTCSSTHLLRCHLLLTHLLHYLPLSPTALSQLHCGSTEEVSL